MIEANTYTLEDLAEAFDLTPRTTRHYIEKVLPPHHKQGRGKLARYGQDTWNCFKFIEKARDQDLTLTQIGNVLAELSQEEIDRVAVGDEELTIVPMSSAIRRPRGKPGPRRTPRASERAQRYVSESGASRKERALWVTEMGAMDADVDFAAEPEFQSPKQPPERWQVLYRDEELQITHRGHADPEQREQVRLAAKLIRNILRKK